MAIYMPNDPLGDLSDFSLTDSVWHEVSQVGGWTMGWPA